MCFGGGVSEINVHESLGPELGRAGPAKEKANASPFAEQEGLHYNREGDIHTTKVEAGRLPVPHRYEALLGGGLLSQEPADPRRLGVPLSLCGAHGTLEFWKPPEVQGVPAGNQASPPRSCDLEIRQEEPREDGHIHGVPGTCIQGLLFGTRQERPTRNPLLRPRPSAGSHSQSG